MVPRAGAGAGRAAHGPGAAAGRRARLAPDRPIRIMALRRSTILGRGGPSLPPRDPGRPRGRVHARDGLRLPVRQEPRVVRRRVPGRVARPRRLALRPARVRGAARELSRGSPEPGAGGTLVPAGPHAHASGGGHRAGVVERQHVRVPDAHAGDALLPVHRAGRYLRGAVKRQIAYAAGGGSRGASARAPTTFATGIRPTSIARSASPTSRSSAASGGTS